MATEWCPSTEKKDNLQKVIRHKDIITTRWSAAMLTKIIENLAEDPDQAKKRQALSDVGFGALLKLHEVHESDMDIWMYKNFDVGKSAFRLNDERLLKVNKEDVKRVYDLPMGRFKIQKGIDWKEQVKCLAKELGIVPTIKSYVLLPVLMDEISKYKDTTSFVKLFILIVCGTIFRPNSRYRVDLPMYAGALSDLNTVAKYNWCDFVYDSVIKDFKTRTSIYFQGDVHFLRCHLMDSLTSSKTEDICCEKPTCSLWNQEKLAKKWKWLKSNVLVIEIEVEEQNQERGENSEATIKEELLKRKVELERKMVDLMKEKVNEERLMEELLMEKVELERKMVDLMKVKVDRERKMEELMKENVKLENKMAIINSKVDQMQSNSEDGQQGYRAQHSPTNSRSTRKYIASTSAATAEEIIQEETETGNEDMNIDPYVAVMDCLKDIDRMHSKDDTENGYEDHPCFEDQELFTNEIGMWQDREGEVRGVKGEWNFGQRKGLNEEVEGHDRKERHTMRRKKLKEKGEPKERERRKLRRRT